MPKVEVNDIEMYYEVHGEGPPLLMLHGFTGSSQMWSQWISEYGPHFQLIIPDYRGHGRTNNPSKEFTHRQASEDVFLLLEHLDLKKIKGLGCSSGADILLHMATKQPDTVESMVLDSTCPYLPKQAREASAAFAPTEERWALYRQIHHFGDDQINLLISQLIGLKDNYDDMNFTEPLLSTIKAKTLVMTGDRDPMYPVKMSTILFESIPDSYLWIVPNAGHALTFGYVDTVKEGILDFLMGKWEES